MHRRRIKDDKVNYPLLLYSKNNEDDFLSVQKSSSSLLQRFSFYLVPSFHHKTEHIFDDDVSMERWYVSRKESSSHPSVYHSIYSRYRFVHFLYKFRDMKDSENNVANRSHSRIWKSSKLYDQKLPSARSCFWKCCELTWNWLSLQTLCDDC